MSSLIRPSTITPSWVWLGEHPASPASTGSPSTTERRLRRDLDALLVPRELINCRHHPPHGVRAEPHATAALSALIRERLTAARAAGSIRSDYPPSSRRATVSRTTCKGEVNTQVSGLSW
jgi:hypothetical protein